VPRYRGEGADVGFDPEYPATLDDRLRVRIKNSVQLHALNDMDAGVSPTQWQRSRYPETQQRRIEVIHEGFDLDVLSPRPDAAFRLPDGRVLTRRDRVLSYVSRNLEPYRGFHVFMRALPELLERCPALQVVIVGGDEVSYGVRPSAPYATYREQLLGEMGHRLPPGRVSFVGKIPYADYVSLMQISSLHVYFSYPFVLSWSLLEAMACGAPVLASDTPPVREVIRHQETGLLAGFYDLDRWCELAGQRCHHPGAEARGLLAEAVADAEDHRAVILGTHHQHRDTRVRRFGLAS
jgi:glycosyltransferase involved in cell wall biosynthesis